MFLRLALILLLVSVASSGVTEAQPERGLILNELIDWHYKILNSMPDTNAVMQLLNMEDPTYIEPRTGLSVRELLNLGQPDESKCSGQEAMRRNKLYKKIIRNPLREFFWTKYEEQTKLCLAKFDERLSRQLEGVQQETRELLGELGDRLLVSVFFRSKMLPQTQIHFAAIMGELKQLSRDSNLRARLGLDEIASPVVFGQLFKRSCTDLKMGLDDVLKFTRAVGYLSQTFRPRSRKWFAALESCRLLDLENLDRLEPDLGLVLNDPTTVQQLRALDQFKERLGLGAEQQALDWTQLVGPDRVDSIFLELLEDRDLMKQVARLKGDGRPSVGDLYSVMSHICATIDRDIAVRVWLVEAEIVSDRILDRISLDQLRSVKVCDFLPVDEQRLERLDRMTVETGKWKNPALKLFGRS